MPGERENRDPDLYSDGQVPGAEGNLSDLPLLRAAQPSRRHLLSTVSATTADCRREKRRAAVEVRRARGWWRHGRTGYRCGAACRTVFIGGAAAIYLSTPPSNVTLPPSPSTRNRPLSILCAADGLAEPLPHTIGKSDVRPALTAAYVIGSAQRNARCDRPDWADQSAPHATPAMRRQRQPASCRPVIVDPPRTPRPTDGPNPTDPPGPVAPQAKFSCQQQGNTLTINCNASNSTGQINSYSWSFGGSGVMASNTYANYGPKDVTLTVSGPGGTTR